MSTKIYTRTGDTGKTSLIGGTKVPKSHIRIEAYGTVDELNAFIGSLADHIEEANSKTVLREIQDRLFTIGSSLASDPERASKMKIPDLHEKDILLLENEIDAMEEELKPLKSFILPGGHAAVSAAHIARCVCRRAERACVLLQENQLFIGPLILQYLNRLSDYLFVFARYIAHRMKVEEIMWKPRV